MTSIRSGGDFIEEMLGDITYNDDIHPFMVRVGCVKMAAPRHERFEYFREMGSADIDRVFNGESFHLAYPTLTFFFPERHMSVHEQQRFMYELARHPDADSIERVDLITSSPLIIGGFKAQSIRILTWDDDEKHNGYRK